MHSTLPAELETFRRSCRSFAEKHFRKYVEPADRGEGIPPEVRALLAEMGAYGLPYPEAVGGGGGSFLSLAVLHVELGRVMPVLGIYFQVNTIVAGMLMETATKAQVERWVPRLLKGESTGFLAFTEPQTGSDVAALTTRAKKVDGGWSISGKKLWISNARTAELGLVFAKDPKDELNIFIVPTSTPGFKVGAQIDILGLRGTELNELSFDNVVVPEDHMLSGGGRTLRKIMPIGKIGICALCVGLMQACLEEAVRYARGRVQQGHPIIDFQAIHRLIADMVALTEASRQLTHWAATCKDQGSDAITELATAKLFVTNSALQVARMAVSVHGVYGIAKGTVVERLLRDVQVFELFEGPSEIQREMVMRAVKDIV